MTPEPAETVSSTDAGDTTDNARASIETIPDAADSVGSTDVALVVGVDVIERERLLRTYSRYGERFLSRVFTAMEVEQAQGNVARLAGRFAAKEACAKALGTGIGAVAWREIEIARLPGGKPSLRLHGRAAARAQSLGLTTFDVSISDTATHAYAIVVGVGMNLTPDPLLAGEGK